MVMESMPRGSTQLFQYLERLHRYVDPSCIQNGAHNVHASLPPTANIGAVPEVAGSRAAEMGPLELSAQWKENLRHTRAARAATRDRLTAILSPLRPAEPPGVTDSQTSDDEMQSGDEPWLQFVCAAAPTAEEEELPCLYPVYGNI